MLDLLDPCSVTVMDRLAEPLMRRALSIAEHSFGNNHPRVATQLNNLAQLLQATNRLAELLTPFARVLAGGNDAMKTNPMALDAAALLAP